MFPLNDSMDTQRVKEFHQVDLQECENGPVLDQEKKIRREIANSNERRRMQSINAGFQSLRTLLPHHEGEKLSKAAILQQTAEYIYSLEQEKTRLLAQNCHLKRLLSISQQHLDNAMHDNVNNCLTTGDDTKRRRVKDENKELTKTSQNSTKAAVVKRETPVEHQNSSRNNEKADTSLHLVNLEMGNKHSETCRIILNEDLIDEDALVSISSTKEDSDINTSTVDDTCVVESSRNVEEGSLDSSESFETAQSCILMGSTKQTLDSIVEAIKHLEGDHLFAEDKKNSQQAVQNDVVGCTLSDHQKNATVSVQQKDNSIIIFKNLANQ